MDGLLLQLSRPTIGKGLVHSVRLIHKGDPEVGIPVPVPEAMAGLPLGKVPGGMANTSLAHRILVWNETCLAYQTTPPSKRQV